MKATTYNQQTYFKGYDARPLKALYLSSPKKELGLELERIGKKAGFDVFIPSGRTLLKASEAKYAYADLSNSPWAQDIATISPKKKIITNEYYDDFADNLSRKLGLYKDFDREIPQGGNMYYVKDTDGKDILLAGQDAQKSIDKLEGAKSVLGVDKIEYIPQMDYHIDLFVRPLDNKRILLTDDSLTIKAFNKGIKSIQKLLKKEPKKTELLVVKENLDKELNKFKKSVLNNVQAPREDVKDILENKGFQVIGVPGRIYQTFPEPEDIEIAEEYISEASNKKSKKLAFLPMFPEELLSFYPCVSKEKSIKPEEQQLTHSLNFMNAIITKNKKGEMVYISNKSDFDKRIGLTPEIIKESGFSFEKEFVNSLKPYIKEENVYFVEGKNGEIQDSLENLAGGIHCLTMEMPQF